MPIRAELRIKMRLEVSGDLLLLSELLHSKLRLSQRVGPHLRRVVHVGETDLILRHVVENPSRRRAAEPTLSIGGLYTPYGDIAGMYPPYGTPPYITGNPLYPAMGPNGDILRGRKLGIPGI